MEIRLKKLSNEAIMPKRVTEGAVAFDLYVPEEVEIPRGRRIIPLGFAIEMPLGYEMKIEPRSGFSVKGMEGADGLRHDADVLVGKIDSDYRGEVGVIVKNSDEGFVIAKGTRIAQATFYKTDPEDYFTEVEELSSTERGSGGFGHTGAK